MNLENTLDILSKKCNDYKRSHEQILTTLDIPNNRLLRDYLRQIKDDPDQWFEAFPREYASIEALAKPKSGLLFLLEKSEDVRNEIGVEFCENLAKIIHATWRKNKKQLLEDRKISANNSDDETSNTISENKLEYDIKMTEIEEKYKKENEDLKERLKKADKANNELMSRIEIIKDIYLSTLKNKGVSDEELDIYKRLLSIW